ncbi:hypothetical protein CALCODRAFT_234505 [Calocera cornea HHB12733]|uniref:Uncharacterized protein n=1 Tax=Calocera cornea HHB12733 TaxID=1353952 RepID=A0A165GXR5_9BASI|nr:hypothetical protein CALCODRAFT_234505 [Calocera cornea HHB12733]
MLYIAQTRPAPRRLKATDYPFLPQQPNSIFDMDVLGTALRFVTGLPQPAVPAPVPTEIIARVPTIRTARGRGRGYGLGVERDRPRRVTRSTGVPLLAATPAPAASGAEFGFNPVIPEAAVGISRTVSVKMEEQELRERRRDTPKRKKAM